MDNKRVAGELLSLAKELVKDNKKNASTLTQGDFVEIWRKTTTASSVLDGLADLLSFSKKHKPVVTELKKASKKLKEIEKTLD